MSSAANDKRGKLEKEFQSRMYDAEASPSQDLWGRIDHELTVRENNSYKRSAMFYRQLAAACIALLLLAGGLGAWYFGSPADTKQPLATVAPATSADPATTLSAPSEEVGQAGTVAATAKTSQQEENALPAAGAAEGNPAEVAAAAPVTIASASGAISRSKAGTATAATVVSPPDAATPVTGTATGALAVAGTPEAAENDNSPIISKSIKQTIAALSPTEQQGRNNSTLLEQSFAAPAAGVKATEDFRKLNEQVMAHAKRMEEQQKAKLLAYNEETASKKDSKKEKNESASRWSLGMAYAPGYFEQNIGLSEQGIGSASRLAMDMDPAATRASSISNSYIEEAREEYAENTDPGFSFGFEVKTGLKLGKKLKLLTGLGFLQNTTRSKSSYSVQQPASFASAGSSSQPSPIFVPSLSADFAASSMFVVKIPEYEVNHRYRYLTVPVELQYEGSMGKDWFWYGGAGVAANMLLQSTILTSAAEVENVEYNLNDDSPFRRLQWSGNVSGGVGKRLPGNMSVTVGPAFRSYFNTLLAEPESTQAPQGRPYAVGLNMAVNYDLSAGKKSR